MTNIIPISLTELEKAFIENLSLRTNQYYEDSIFRKKESTALANIDFSPDYKDYTVKFSDSAHAVSVSELHEWLYGQIRHGRFIGMLEKHRDQHQNHYLSSLIVREEGAIALKGLIAQNTADLKAEFEKRKKEKVVKVFLEIASPKELSEIFNLSDLPDRTPNALITEAKLAVDMSQQPHNIKDKDTRLTLAKIVENAFSKADTANLLNEQDKEAALARMAENFVANRRLGATMQEIGLQFSA